MQERFVNMDNKYEYEFQWNKYVYQYKQSNK